MNDRTAVAVVDDDPGMLQSIERILDLRGFKARAFDSVEDFLRDRSATKSRCLVLDVNLGETSGIDLCRQLRASGAKIPVIFITASDDSMIRSRALEAGCVAFLHKPFTANALFDAISKASPHGSAQGAPSPQGG